MYIYTYIYVGPSCPINQLPQGGSHTERAHLCTHIQIYTHIDIYTHIYSTASGRQPPRQRRHGRYLETDIDAAVCVYTHTT